MDGYKQLNYYRLTPDEVLEQVHSSKNGLSAIEAKERLEQLGNNELQKTKKTWIGFVILRQFRQLLVLLLLVSAAFSFYLRDARTGLILTAIALINVSVGFFQEYKAETLMESLEKLIVPQSKVFRDGKLEEIASTELVLGDVIQVTAGDSIPADVRILFEQELATNDFALTGESNPTRKFVHAMTSDVPIANRHNLLFMGTTVALGSGRGVVIGTGMHTELGRIASLSQSTKSDSSPLQREMDHLAKRITQGTAILAVILTTIALRSHLGLKQALLFAIGISAAMIPNGLAAEVSITLAQTASRMAKARALIKKLSAVETLGATNIVATDKTGTLTKNEMTVERLLIGRTEYGVTGTGYETDGTIVDSEDSPLTHQQLEEINLFFATGAMASNARVNPPDDEHAVWYCVGDPTEGALITLAHKAGVDSLELDEKYEEIKEFQFDSARKRMSSVRHYGRGKELYVFTKGAPESVLERCTDMWDHGHVRKLTKKDRTNFLKYNENRAREAMRNLAFAYRILPTGSDPTQMKFEDIEQGLTFLGIASMVDPLREQVPNAMEVARAAHIKVSVITGDYPATAEAIVRKAKLLPEDKEVTVILGQELPKLADAQILQLVSRGGVVFSRVAPEDKLRIVEVIKQSGKVVAVTGDGINDAPALKRADIGVAMGKTGTDVAKEAAEIVLLDDSFHTLVSAIEQGRLTFRNITKAARCALTDNAGELMTVLIGLASQTLFHVPVAITAVQILAIDVVAEMFPITALGWDPAQHELMTDKPRNLREHIINRKAVTEFLAYGLLSSAIAYTNFLLFFARNHVSVVNLSTISPLYMKGTILTYLTIVLCQFTNLLLVRTDDREPFFTRYIWSNKKLLIAFCFSFFCIANMMYNPWVRPYFNAGPLSVTDWLCAFAGASIYFIIRLFERYSRKHSRRAVVALHQQYISGAGRL